MLKGNGHTRRIIKNPVLILSCIIVLIMGSLYFFRFFNNGIAVKTSEFADFGNYFGSILTFITIIILLSFNISNLKEVVKSNRIADENLKWIYRSDRKRDLVALISEASARMKITMHERINNETVLAFFFDLGSMSKLVKHDSDDLNKILKEIMEAEELEIGEVNLENIFVMAQALLKSEGMTDEEIVCEIMLRLDKNKGELDELFRIIKNFEIHSMYWIQLLDEYSKLETNLHEVLFYAAEFARIIQDLSELEYISKLVSKPIECWYKAETCFPVKKVEYSPLYFKDVRSSFEEILRDNGLSPQIYTLYDMNNDGEKIIIKCVNMENNQILEIDITEIEKKG